jgi:hypothetical protein
MPIFFQNYILPTMPEVLEFMLLPSVYMVILHILWKCWNFRKFLLLLRTENIYIYIYMFAKKMPEW